MKTTRFFSASLAVVLLVSTGAARGQTEMGTAFTYQGQLKQRGQPFDGTADFEFTLWDAAVGGTQVAGPVALSNEPVSDGLFTVSLDFGEDIFTGEARWLEIVVDGTTLSPRQELTPAPYALALPGLWTQQDAMSPNLIGGYSGNVVASDAHGATIGGGGRVAYLNCVYDNHATVAGGANNTAGSDDGDPASAYYATVGGGRNNVAGARNATVGGGYGNSASGYYASVPGGLLNVAGGDYSFAAGRRAKANHQGTFVWADSTNADFASAGSNQFVIRASGGVGINTNDPEATLHIGGTPGVSGIMFPDETLQTTAATGGSASVPIGAVIDWWRPDDNFPVPDGYQICNGGVVNDPQSPFNGETLPDLRNRFARGAYTPAAIGQTGGASTHTHSISGTTQLTQVHMMPPDTTECVMPMYPTGVYCARFDHSHYGYGHNHEEGNLANSTTSHLPPYVGLLKIMRIR